MYKKSLAVLLSVLIIATSLISLFSFSASANSMNLVADGKFENGFSDWQVFNNSGISADFNVVEEGDNHVLSAVSGLSMFKAVTLEAGVEYTVGFDFKFDTNASVPATYDSFYRVGFANSVAAIGNSNFVGPYASGNKYYSVYTSQKNDPNNWKSHTFTYTPSSNMTTYFVVGSYNGDSKANFFVDNVFLAKTSDLVTVTTVAGDGGAVSGGIKTFKGDSVTVKALPSVGYELDGWYNAASQKLSSDLNYTFDINANVELTAKFKVATYNPNLIVNGDFSKQNLDDFEVFKNGNNSSVDPVFTAFGEDYILSAKAGHSLFKKVDLKGGTSYTMSFDFRFASANVPSTFDSYYRAGFVNSVAAIGGSIFVGPNATGNKYYSIYPYQKTAPTTWKNHSFTFTPATDMSVWAVVGSYNHDGVADFELDNWMLYKTSDIITITAVADEGGSANGTATVLSGEKVVLTATAEDGYEFLGWYNEDLLVSTEAEYTHTATENITLVAKFKSTAPISNYIVNGDFEKPFATDTISNVSVPAVTGKWGKIYSGVTRMEATETASFTSFDSAEKNGTRYITSGATKDSNQYIRAFGQYVELPAGDYVLEFDAKSTISNVFVVSVKKGQNSIAANDLVHNYLDESSEWNHYKINFTADAAGLYQIAFGGNTQGKGEGDFSIDNVSLEVFVEENAGYIVNGDFEKPFTTDKISDVNLPAVLGKWGRIYSGVTRMEATETASFTSFDSAEKNGTRYITSGSTKDSNKYIRAFGQYVELLAGDYVLEFDAKSTIGEVFVASIKKGQNSIAANDLVYNHLDESLEWKHYKIIFTADTDGLYQIAFGGNTQGGVEGDFSIDNVSLDVYVEENLGYIVNGDFEKPFTTDKISDVNLPAVLGKWGRIYSGVTRMEAIETANFTSYDSAELNGTRYITSGATKDSNKYIRAFGQYVELPAGDYVLEFDAKSTASNMFVASVKKGQNSIAANDLVYNHLDESLEWKHYKIIFTADADGLYQIAFGGNTQGKGEGDFSIDNVSLDVYVEENAGYIVNGDFEKPFTTDKISDVNLPAVLGKWGRIYSGVTRMEAIETANFTSYDSAELNGARYITSGATKDENQYIRGFGQYVNLVAGEYVLEFDAKSDVSDFFVVSVKKGQDAINQNDLVYNHLDESLEWKHYKIIFTADADGLYQIAFGGNMQNKGAGDFSIDNVSLDVYVEENPSYIVNGDFEKPFTTDKISDVNLPAVLGKWGRIYSGVARMEATETVSFTSFDSAEKNGTRYITSGATKDENQYIRAFGQYATLPAGDYVLEFDAKSTASNMFVVSVKKGQNSIAANDLVYRFLDESAEWKHYTIRFNLAEEGLYQIAFGGNTEKKGAADFSIDNVGLFNAEGYVTVTAVTDGGGKVTYPIGDLEIGSTATVIATADAGYVFAGWYNGTELVSADASYTFTVTETVELKAKFDLNLGDDDVIVKNGNFDIGSTAGWNVVKNHTGSAIELIVDTDTGSMVAHTTGNGAIALMQKVNLKANTEYLISFDFKFDNFESIPEEYNSFYRSGFLADPNGGLGNANFVGPNVEEKNNVYLSLANIIVTEDKNAWNSISYTFTPATDMETWFVIGAYNEQGVSNYSIDNIAILPKKDVTGITLAVVNHGGSGKATSSKTGIVSPGENVTLTATPNKGSAFDGWYTNGVLISENAHHVYEIKGNDLVYARFVDAANPNSNQMLDNSDFATGDLSGWGKNNIASANNTIEYVTESGESYVKLGESDMLYQPVELEPYSTYMIRITTRIPDIKKNSYQVHDLTFFRFGISEYDKPNVLQSGALEKDPYSYTSSLVGQCDCEQNNRFHCAMQWNTYTYIYSNNSPDTVLANVVIGTPYCKSDLHIKKFEFVKYVDGIVDFESDILYGEDFFNNVKNPSFEEKTTDADWGAKLPNGWTIKNEGVNGTNYLSVSGNESKTYTFKVRAGTTYVVAFSLRTKGVGNASVSIVDDNGKTWGDSFGLVSDTAAFSPQANGEWQRMGAHLYLADNEEGYTNVNIKITGGSNVLDIDEVTIVKLGYATHTENPNVYTDNSFDYNNPLWYDPTTFYKLPDGTTVDGAVEDPYANKN